MAFQHKLKELRESRGLSMEELVSELHNRYSMTINKSTVSRWENGAEPKGKDLHYLAHFFKVSPAELIDIELLSEDPPQKENVLQFIPNVPVPFFGTVAAGALAAVDGVTQENVEFLAMPRQFLGKYADCTKLFAMVVNGESMNKVVKHGSVVVAKPIEIDQYKSGDIVIFSYNNEYSLKRFAPDELEGFVLFKSESDDPAFKDIPIPKSELSSLKLYGKIVYYGTTI